MADHRLQFVFAAGAAMAALAVSAAAQDRGDGGYDRGDAPAAQDRGFDRGYAPDGQDQDGGPGYGRGDERGFDRGDERGFDRGDERGPPAFAGRLAGPGVDLLLPVLRDSWRGRAFVMRRFDFNRDGLVEPGEARAANRAFRAGAPLGGDRYGGRDEGERAPPPPPPAYDAGAMRDYHFRQNSYGAVFTLQDVLFETGSARLRPQADAKLRPLAGYLRAHAGQQLRVDGYTDSVGTAQANLILSRDRARSVADALTALGVDGGRLHLEGHGEDSPVASNLNAAGRQENRRVEVTLVGARAANFD